MSAVGIDFGNETCYVAVAKAGGLETVTNDYSQRATPSYVAFGPTCRDLGTSAKNKVITNIKNTVYSFKRLIGKKFHDRSLQHELSYLPYQIHELPNGSIGFKVSYLGNHSIFTVHQIAAMLLTKLKDITETACRNTVTDCVISVPLYFSDSERRALLDVCQIANLNVLRLLNDTTAIALAYGFYKQDLSDSKPKRVMFVDMGHSAIQASICDFYQGKLKVICNLWDFCVGGRDIDNALVRHFSKEFKTKYNLDVLSNHRAIVRLLQECEKLKKQLSASLQVLPLNIECFMEDKDVSSSLGREELEQLCADSFRRVEDILKRLMSEANLSPGDIHAVEIIGGSTRIPAIKNIIKKVTGIEPSTTLNQDEAVARGCALQAAMLSPNVKVRDFSVSDAQPYAIKLVWNISETECGDIEVFPRNHSIPFSKQLTFFRKEDFTLNAYYSPGTDEESFIGSFTIKNVSQMPSGESGKIIIKLRININGIFSICSAVIADKDSKENNNLDQKAEDLMDLKKDSSVPVDSLVNEEKRNFFSLKKHKNVCQEIELQIEPKVPQLSESDLRTFTEIELQMIDQDIIEEKRINAKNSVEERDYEEPSCSQDTPHTERGMSSNRPRRSPTDSSSENSSESSIEEIVNPRGSFIHHQENGVDILVENTPRGRGYIRHSRINSRVKALSERMYESGIISKIEPEDVFYALDTHLISENPIASFLRYEDEESGVICLVENNHRGRQFFRNKLVFNKYVAEDKERMRKEMDEELEELSKTILSESEDEFEDDPEDGLPSQDDEDEY